MDRFWTVYGKESPNGEYRNREAAEDYAKGMAAKFPGQAFSVMECVSAFKCPVGAVEPVHVDPPWIHTRGFMTECPVHGDCTIEVDFGMRRGRTGKARDLWALQDNGGPVIYAYRVIEQPGE